MRVFEVAEVEEPVLDNRTADVAAEDMTAESGFSSPACFRK